MSYHYVIGYFKISKVNNIRIRKFEFVTKTWLLIIYKFGCAGLGAEWEIVKKRILINLGAKEV